MTVHVSFVSKLHFYTDCIKSCIDPAIRKDNLEMFRSCSEYTFSNRVVASKLINRKRRLNNFYFFAFFEGFYYLLQNILDQRMCTRVRYFWKEYFITVYDKYSYWDKCRKGQLLEDTTKLIFTN